MRKRDAIKHFGGVRELAAALGIWPTAVAQWGDCVPPRRAYEIEKITQGKLKADPETYREYTAH